MDANKRTHRERRILVMAVSSLLAPLAVAGIGTWHVLRAVGSKRFFIGLSVLGNILFASALTMGYLESAMKSDSLENVAKELVAPNCVSRASGPLVFCDALPGSDLAYVEPQTIFIAFHNMICIRVAFDDEIATIEEVGVFDKSGRPWIDADLKEGTYIYHRYGSGMGLDPLSSLRDKDGDGIPDVYIDWREGVSFQRREDLTWDRLSGE